jgi:hypothetical protein
MSWVDQLVVDSCRCLLKFAGPAGNPGSNVALSSYFTLIHAPERQDLPVTAAYRKVLPLFGARRGMANAGANSGKHWET